MSKDLLFSPLKFGRIELKNRAVMSPMTRSRSPGNVPNKLVATYYAQRAEAGLIITEGTSPSPNGLGYARIPGLYSAEQTAGWKKVADAVHAAGGKIFAQLMHTGRVTHPANLPAGGRVLSASAVGAKDPMYVDGQGMLPVPVPEAMTEADIEAAIEEFAHAGENAVAAALDGIELHGANGYLIDQFLNTATNQRTDRWGGSIENRIRFAVEVSKRVAKKIGGDRVGIRISPWGAFNGMVPDAEMEALYLSLAHTLDGLGILYLHVVDHSGMGAPPLPATIKAKLREAFEGKLILSGSYDRARAEADLEAGKCELVAFGRPFLANPKLVTKMRENQPLTAPDFATFYTPGEKGYTDYPA